MTYGRKTGLNPRRILGFSLRKLLILNTNLRPLISRGDPSIIAILDWDIYISFNLYSLQEIK